MRSSKIPRFVELTVDTEVRTPTSSHDHQGLKDDEKEDACSQSHNDEASQLSLTAIKTRLKEEVSTRFQYHGVSPTSLEAYSRIEKLKLHKDSILIHHAAAQAKIAAAHQEFKCHPTLPRCQTSNTTENNSNIKEVIDKESGPLQAAVNELRAQLIRDDSPRSYLRKTMGFDLREIPAAVSSTSSEREQRQASEEEATASKNNPQMQEVQENIQPMHAEADQPDVDQRDDVEEVEGQRLDNLIRLFEQKANKNSNNNGGPKRENQQRENQQPLPQETKKEVTKLKSGRASQGATSKDDPSTDPQLAVSRLKLNLRDMDHKLKAAEEQARRDRNCRKENEQRVTKLEQNEKNLTNQLQQARLAKTHAETKLRGLMTRMSDAEQQLVTAEQKLKDAQSLRKQAQDKANARDKQVKELRGKLSVAEKRLIRSNKNVQLMRDDNNNSSKCIEILRKMVEQKQNEVKVKTQELKERDDKHRKEMESYKKKSRNVAALQKRVTELEEQVHQLQDEQEIQCRSLQSNTQQNKYLLASLEKVRDQYHQECALRIAAQSEAQHLRQQLLKHWKTSKVKEGLNLEMQKQAQSEKAGGAVFRCDTEEAPQPHTSLTLKTETLTSSWVSDSGESILREDKQGEENKKQEIEHQIAAMQDTKTPQGAAMANPESQAVLSTRQEIEHPEQLQITSRCSNHKGEAANTEEMNQAEDHVSVESSPQICSEDNAESHELDKNASQSEIGDGQRATTVLPGVRLKCSLLDYDGATESLCEQEHPFDESTTAIHSNTVEPQDANEKIKETIQFKKVGPNDASENDEEPNTNGARSKAANNPTEVKTGDPNFLIQSESMPDFPEQDTESPPLTSDKLVEANRNERISTNPNNEALSDVLENIPNSQMKEKWKLQVTETESTTLRDNKESNAVLSCSPREKSLTETKQAQDEKSLFHSAASTAMITPPPFLSKFRNSKHIFKSLNQEYNEGGSQWAEKTQELLAGVPSHIQDMYRQVGFYKDRKRNMYVPVLCLSPFDMPPGPAQIKVLEQPSEVVGIYIYGQSSYLSAYQHIKWFRFLSYEDGVKKGLDKYPKHIQVKLKRKSPLFGAEKDLVHGLDEARTEVLKHPEQRLHPFQQYQKKVIDAKPHEQSMALAPSPEKTKTKDLSLHSLHKTKTECPVNDSHDKLSCHHHHHHHQQAPEDSQRCSDCEPTSKGVCEAKSYSVDWGFLRSKRECAPSETEDLRECLLMGSPCSSVDSEPFLMKSPQERQEHHEPDSNYNKHFNESRKNFNDTWQKITAAARLEVSATKSSHSKSFGCQAPPPSRRQDDIPKYIIANNDKGSSDSLSDLGDIALLSKTYGEKDELIVMLQQILGNGPQGDLD